MTFLPASRTLLPALAAVLATSLTLFAQDPPLEAQLREGDSLMAGQQYEEALTAYRSAQASANTTVRVRAGAGAVRALLRLAQFRDASREAAAVAARDPDHATALAAHGDALWASGLFLEAEARYAEALRTDPADPAALHGRGRSLAAQGRSDDALRDVGAALAGDPDELSYHYTLALIHKLRHDFRAAADTLARYQALLPPEDQSDLTRWTATQERFLRSFGSRTPSEIVSDDDLYELPFRIRNDRVLVQGTVNGRTPVEFAIDTGTDQTILTPRVAQQAGIRAGAVLQTAGVGVLGWGFRGLEIARINELTVGRLRVRNLPGVIKNPALTTLPRPEGAGFSPLAIGLSARIDYARGVLVMGRRLPDAPAAIRLPLRIERVPMVRGVINRVTPAAFVLDTGSDATVLGRRVAERLGGEADPTLRRVPARVFGSAGWDPTAFLMPFLDLEFAPGAGFAERAIVVVNLDAPSGLLGIELGGIVGHDLLSRFVVTLDLVRSELALQPIR